MPLHHRRSVVTEHLSSGHDHSTHFEAVVHSHKIVTQGDLLMERRKLTNRGGREFRLDRTLTSNQRWVGTLKADHEAEQQSSHLAGALSHGSTYSHETPVDALARHINAHGDLRKHTHSYHSKQFVDHAQTNYRSVASSSVRPPDASQSVWHALLTP